MTGPEYKQMMLNAMLKNRLHMNNNFYDKDAIERASIMEQACENAGVDNFFDLEPEDRAAAYNRENK